MEIHYIAYYVLIATATLGALFAPRVRLFCSWLLLLSVIGYAAKYGMAGMFGDGKDGFGLAVIDVTIGAAIASRFSSVHLRICALMFAVAAYAHYAMTSAYVAQQANMFYTNYELIIAATSIIQAMLIFGGYYRDVYRFIVDNLYGVSNSKNYSAVNKVHRKTQ